MRMRTYLEVRNILSILVATLRAQAAEMLERKSSAAQSALVDIAEGHYVTQMSEKARRNMIIALQEGLADAFSGCIESPTSVKYIHPGGETMETLDHVIFYELSGSAAMLSHDLAPVDYGPHCATGAAYLRTSDMRNCAAGVIVDIGQRHTLSAILVDPKEFTFEAHVDEQRLNPYRRGDRDRRLKRVIVTNYRHTAFRFRSDLEGRLIAAGWEIVPGSRSSMLDPVWASVYGLAEAVIDMRQEWNFGRYKGETALRLHEIAAGIPLLRAMRWTVTDARRRDWNDFSLLDRNENNECILSLVTCPEEMDGRRDKDGGKLNEKESAHQELLDICSEHIKWLQRQGAAKVKGEKEKSGKPAAQRRVRKVKDRSRDRRPKKARARPRR